MLCCFLILRLGANGLLYSWPVLFLVRCQLQCGLTRLICISVKVPTSAAFERAEAEGACAWASEDAVTRNAVTPRAIKRRELLSESSGPRPINQPFLAFV